jgi:phosphatidylglycerophosphatase A
MDGSWAAPEQYRDYLLARFNRPTPRLQLGPQLLDCASSAIDVSDGLLADAGHLCTQGKVGISLDAHDLPLSPALQSHPDREQALGWALGGGDDYELLFTVPPQNISRLPPGCTRVGEVTEGDTVSCEHPVAAAGYRHFSTGSEAGAAGESSTGRDPRPFGSWIQFLAFGFGSGLSPRAPGTAGTVIAVPLYLLLFELGLPAYTLVLVLASLLGIWLCGRASRELGVHDHPGIVWDEFVGYWITMWGLPADLSWAVAGFFLFRLFDILKPWPISLCDRRVHGGLGIMLDDILAGLASCAILQCVFWLVSA